MFIHTKNESSLKVMGANVSTTTAVPKAMGPLAFKRLKLLRNKTNWYSLLLLDTIRKKEMETAKKKI